MGTSITDGRYTSLHFTRGHMLAMLHDEAPETGWGVMPGYEESLEIPEHLRPPNLDADEILPSQMHPSYPYGRPPTASRRVKPWMNGVGNLLGTVNQAQGSGSTWGQSGPQSWREKAGTASTSAAQGPGGLASVRWGERWDELAMAEFLETRRGKEVPPGMAGAKRPPSPPRPSLFPEQIPSPRSQHIRSLQARRMQQQLRQQQQQQQQNGAGGSSAEDAFDAPVPNETYVAPEAGQHPHDPNASNGSIEGIGGVGGITAPRLSGNSLGMAGIDEE